MCDDNSNITFCLFLIAALSLLRSSEEKAPVPQNKFMGDIEELAASYERKLIEVSAVNLLLPFICFFLMSTRCYIGEEAPLDCISVVKLVI